MKRLLLSLGAIGFGFGMVVISAIAIAQEQTDIQPVEIQTEASQSAEPVLIQIEENEDSNPVNQVDYYLPYPGILPDHVLYPLKMMRDQVRLWLANSTEKKMELQWLYADKRIGAAEVLVSGGKADLGVKTAVKANGYLKQAVDQAEKLGDLVDWPRLSRAIERHQQIIEGLLVDLEGSDLSELERIEEQTKALQERVSKRVPETESSEEMSEEPTLIEELYPAELGQ